MTTCDVPNCTDVVHARGMCGRHYQQWRKGLDPYAAAPRPVDTPGWAPPRDLSPQWHDRNRARAPEPTRRPQCALSACGGVSVAGSPYCAAHKAYRAAQARLKAKV